MKTRSFSITIKKPDKFDNNNHNYRSNSEGNKKK